jgi:hypothetical protein
MSYAYVNHGRWVAHCETDGCSGAEMVWPGGAVRELESGRKYGISRQGVLHCGNCGQTSQVSFPAERPQITRILNRRPVPETRNWYPGETAEGLAAENAEKGVD